MMLGYIHVKKDTNGNIPKSATTDDPLISRLWEGETVDSLLDMAVSERNRCERAKACDEDFLRFVVILFNTIVMESKPERVSHSAGHILYLNPQLTSRADDIITLTQHVADRADRLGDTTQHEMLSMQADMLRSMLTGNHEGLEHRIRQAPRVVAHAERDRARDWARLMSRLDKGKQLRTNDVDLLFEVLEDSPDERGQIALNMRKYYVGALLKDPTGLLLIEDPLFT